VRDQDKTVALALAKRLDRLGYTIYATLGTSTLLRDQGIRSEAIFRISKGRPNVLDLIEECRVGWVINTPFSGTAPMDDEIRMRSRAVMRGIPVTTTMAGFEAAVTGLESLLGSQEISVCSLQEYHRNAPRMNLTGGF
jgi:carbamoyl-phosphate synthase large subunit